MIQKELTIDEVRKTYFHEEVCIRKSCLELAFYEHVAQQLKTEE